MSPADWRTLTEGIALIATDLDGTLVRHDGSVSQFTVDTLARARAAALPVVFVTGRPPRWIPPVSDVTGHHGVAICANGGLLIDIATTAVIESYPISPEALESVVTVLRAEVPGIAFGAEWVPTPDAQPFAHERAYQSKWPVPDAVTDADVREFTSGRSVTNLLARINDPTHHVDAFLNLALHHVEDLVEVTHSDSSDVLLEMSAAGVTKGSTLARYAASIGVASRHAAAMGDMPNDVSMLTWAGVGLGITGGHAWVMEAADALLPGPGDDGVAHFISAVLAGR